MGFPVNDFAIYEAIINGRQNALNLGYSEQCPLRRFKAYALILHHPKLHAEFHEVIEAQFEMLDVITGEDLLFFSMSKPPRGWFEKAAERDYMNIGSSMQKVSASSVDSGLGAILTSLGLSMEYLPCIIVTTNMRQKDWHIIRVNQKTISPVLHELGQWAKNSGLVNTLPSKIKGTPLTPVSSPEQLSKLLSPSINAKFSKSNPIAKNLSDVNLLDIQNTIQMCRDMLCKGDGQNREHQKDLEHLDKLMLYILHLQAAIAGVTNDEDNFPTIPIELLEGDSHIIYSSLRHWQAYAKHPPLQKFDYSPGIVSAAKIIEIEQTKSLVHWARKVLGVSLPEYYCRYHPEAGACIVGNDETPIDFNYQRNGKWIPPTLGKGLNGIRQLLKKHEAPGGYEKRVLKELFNRIDSIISVRNPAAHSRHMTLNEWTNTSDAFLYFLTNEGFEKYNSIKSSFKPGTTVIANEPIPVNLVQTSVRLTGVHFNCIETRIIPQQPNKKELQPMKKEEVDKTLEKIFTNRYSPPEVELVPIISATAYYLDTNTPSEVRKELNLLWTATRQFEYQKALMKAISDSRSKNFRLDTGLDRYHNMRGDAQVPQEITINPTITITETSDTELINENKRVGDAIQKYTIDIALLLSFIKESAIKSGDWKWE